MTRRGRPHKCPHCKGVRTVSKGTRRTTTMGLRLLRLCRECGRKFTVQRRGWWLC